MAELSVVVDSGGDLCAGVGCQPDDGPKHERCLAVNEATGRGDACAVDESCRSAAASPPLPLGRVLTALERGVSENGSLVDGS